MNVPCSDDREKSVHALRLSVIKMVFDDASAPVIYYSKGREEMVGREGEVGACKLMIPDAVKWCEKYMKELTEGYVDAWTQTMTKNGGFQLDGLKTE